MANRLKLDRLLRNILGTDNVYYQPPESIKLKYPCIVYEMSGSENSYADNVKYIKNKTYKITYIDKNPDAVIPDKIEDLPYCDMTTAPYPADGLNHWVFEIYIPETKEPDKTSGS